MLQPYETQLLLLKTATQSSVVCGWPLLQLLYCTSTERPSIMSTFWTFKILNIYYRPYLNFIRRCFYGSVCQWTLWQICSCRSVYSGASKPRGNDAFCVIGNVGEKLKDAVTRCDLRPVDASKCVSDTARELTAPPCPPDRLSGFGGREQGRENGKG